MGSKICSQLICILSAHFQLGFSSKLKCPSSARLGSENFQLGLARAGKFQLEPITTGQVWSMTFALLALVFLTCCHVFCVALQKLRANVVAPAAANNLSGTTRTILVDNGEGVLIYEDDVVSKEVRSAARTPFADPNFLQAIGSSFLERVTKNNEQADKEVR